MYFISNFLRKIFEVTTKSYFTVGPAPSFSVIFGIVLALGSGTLSSSSFWIDNENEIKFPRDNQLYICWISTVFSETISVWEWRDPSRSKSAWKRTVNPNKFLFMATRKPLGTGISKRNLEYSIPKMFSSFQS